MKKAWAVAIVAVTVSILAIGATLALRDASVSTRAGASDREREDARSAASAPAETGAGTDAEADPEKVLPEPDTGAMPSAGPEPVTEATSVLEGAYTEAQAARGRQVFGRSCVLCHAPAEFSGPIFQLTWAGGSVARLYDRMSTKMPLDFPGSLDPAEYAAVIAYFLQENGYPAGAGTLPADGDALARIRLERLPN